MIYLFDLIIVMIHHGWFCQPCFFGKSQRIQSSFHWHKSSWSQLYHERNSGPVRQGFLLNELNYPLHLCSEWCIWVVGKGYTLMTRWIQRSHPQDCITNQSKVNNAGVTFPLSRKSDACPCRRKRRSRVPINLENCENHIEVEWNEIHFIYGWP